MTNTTKKSFIKSAKTRTIAAAMAVTCIFSATALTAVSVSAASVNYNPTNAVRQVNMVSKNSTAKNFVFKSTGKTSYGYDWTYSIDRTNVSVNCSYDFKTHQYTFNVKGLSAGKVNVKLMYKTSDKNWEIKSFVLNVDKNLNVTQVK